MNVEIEVIQNPKSTIQNQIAVADGILLIVAFLAGILRFVDLGRLPLSPTEAQAAWDVWRFWQPGTAELMTTSPAYFSLTAVLMSIFGDSDVTARLIPVLFGIGLVLLPRLLVNRLGQVGSLVTSGLLAISPLLTVTARAAGGDSMALFALGLMMTAVLRFEDEPEPRWLITLFAGLGLGLGSSPLFYGGLLTLILARLLAALVQPGFSWREVWMGVELPSHWKAVAVGGGVFLSTSALFLWYPAGISSAAMLPVAWLSQFTFQGGLAALLNPILAIGRYEPLLVAPGIAVMIWAAWRNRQTATLLVYWTTAVLALILLQRSEMSNTLLLLLPAYSLLGLFSQEVFAPRIDLNGWSLGGALTVAGLLIAVNLARLSRAIVVSPQEFLPMWVILLAAVVGLVLIYFMAGWDMKATMQGILIGLLALVSIYNWGTAWWLGHEAANDPRERWVSQGTDDDVPMLQTILQDISRQAARSRTDLSIFSSVNSPVIGWYLRDFHRLEMGHTIPDNAQFDVIITPANANPSLGGEYRGADFGLLRLEPEPTAADSPFFDAMRWWLFHDSRQQPAVERLILWWNVSIQG